jgi:hypothetical protein
LVDALPDPVEHGAVGEQRDPAGLHRVDQLITAADVEEGVLLAGERRRGKILRGG